MLQFKKPELSDRQWVTECVNASGYMGCEYSFCNIYTWNETYKTKIARYKDFFIAKGGEGGKTRYCMPAGRGSAEQAIKVIIEDAEQNGIKPVIYGVTRPQIGLINELFGDRFDFYDYRDGFDYIYSSKELTNLSGKKFHAKRNHVSRFERDYNWTYEPIDGGNIEECFELHGKWKEMDRNKDRTDLGHEVCALHIALSHFEELNLFGALLRVDGQAIAFTIADSINDKAVDIHFEKALDGYNGAYAAINQKFCANTLSSYEYVNREEDLGIEGLRRAKLSYHPTILLEKFTAVSK